MLKPELLKSLKSYSGKTFVSDLSSGIIVGVVALPLAIAFAIASGVSPERGIFTAIIAGFVVSAFGGSKVQIGGPTGAFVVIIYDIIQKFGYSGLMTATILAGILLILVGVFKLGGLIKFIPYTIITGFTTGIAVTIFTTQIGDFLGLTTGKMPGDFVGKLSVYANSLGTMNYYAFAMAAISLVIIFVWPKINKKIPGSLIVIIIATLANLIIEKYTSLSLDTIGSRYHAIPSSFPSPTMPNFSIETITALFPSAISIAVLCAIESLLSAVVADGMIGAKHDSDMELIAQGVANILSPIFGGIPATGAIARTATNIKNGGKTPIAGIIHSLTLLAIMLFFGKFVVYIPMAALAAVLVSVAWNMAGFSAVHALLKGQKSDIAVLLITFALTVFVDLTVAIEVGLLVAAFLFIKKMVDLSEVKVYSDTIIKGLETNNSESNSILDADETFTIPKSTIIYDIAGPLFFGTVRKFQLAVEESGADCKVLILRMRNTMYLDAGGIEALKQLKNACDKAHISIVLSGVKTQPFMLMEKTGTVEAIGKNNIFTNITDAISRAKEITK